MRSKLVPALAVAAALSIACGAARGQSDDRFVNDVDAKQRAACTPDVQRLCNEYIPDVPAIVACLTRQRAALSPACADVFAVPEDCNPDVELLCANAPLPGLLACLKQAGPRLSAACATAFAESDAQATKPAKPTKKSPKKPGAAAR